MQKEQLKTGLVWFRNDLRSTDNEVLSKAILDNDRVIGIYCFNPEYYEATQFGFSKIEKFRAKFILESVMDLKSILEDLNVSLLVYFEDPSSAISRICKAHGISSLYLQKEWTSEEVAEENKVKTHLYKNVEWHHLYNQFLFQPNDVSIDFSKIPEVFTVFRKKLEKQVKVRDVVKTPSIEKSNLIDNNTELPSLGNLGFQDFEVHPHSAFPFRGGESAAHNRLQDYFFEKKKLGVYKKTRNGLIGTDYSSKFSPWLANGCISARQIYQEVKRFEKENFSNQSTYWLIFELIWRDYFKYISLKHGDAIFKIGGILNKEYDWSKQQKAINQWVNGETRSDFVNANMKEIKATGWMSNRGRQNVASYFAKNQELDWRIGAAYFEAQLLDYDVHSNYGNWMYVAGVGNDPRDRKFNVESQAERYDTNGKYRKLWLQETLF